MTTFLIIGATAVGQSVAERLLAADAGAVRLLHTPQEHLVASVANRVTEYTGDLRKEATYQAPLQDQPVVFSALTGMDVDLAFEALFDAQYHQRLTYPRFVMLSTAGVDHEVEGDLTYPGISATDEYLNQQRYAAKLVDEAEFPYTILRPVAMVDRPEEDAQIIPEGHPVPAGQVARETVAVVATDVLINGGYDYQSIAIC